MLKSLWKRFPGKSRQSFDTVEEVAENVGLHLREVLAAHSAWKRRLARLFKEGDRGRIDLITVADDRICELGRWLHGPGRDAFGKLEEYHEAVEAHAAFHKTAAEVVVEFKSGNRKKAAELLRTRFRDASNCNQMALVMLFMAARK
ncbi:CZB domain-containing protein [endosymbiont of unidentified scaly snail isolate Monju]|uniref:CZB domain-containing protein n=1 Tax=endosymbiont of unidentified scaly snail isolate Monju TaxID=1248727 RepID=UPI00038924CF|nr:CZB domain-containing protein [endosymbiont of unidentified scaly snail isolate Monju]BAN69510.1 hypothetical protein EBS_1630 [endosymbiont of unidentified scaly snail isolate Monju]